MVTDRKFASWYRTIVSFIVFSTPRYSLQGDNPLLGTPQLAGCWRFADDITSRPRHPSNELRRRLLTLHLLPPGFSHANADAPPTGLFARVFARAGVFSFGLSVETVRLSCGLACPSPSVPSRCLPSSKNLDWLDAGDDPCERLVDSVRVPDF